MPRNDGSLIEELLTLGEKTLKRLMDSRHKWHEHAHSALFDIAQKFDLVTHDEFDAALAMIAKARAIQEDLKERLDALESKLNQSGVTMNRKAPAKPVRKKMKTKKQSLPSVKQGNRRKRR